jgi:hypothetical protein
MEKNWKKVLQKFDDCVTGFNKAVKGVVGVGRKSQVDVVWGVIILVFFFDLFWCAKKKKKKGQKLKNFIWKN